jgi:MarR family transcriptional regulator for hemolysin
VPRPTTRTPIGLQLAGVARVVSRAFDDALAEAGGSVPVWLVLIAVKRLQRANQRELADAVGIQGATLTYHLNAMEAAGLVIRRRNPENRRTHTVELTPDGEALFLRLRDAVYAFDRRLRSGLGEVAIAQLELLLGRLRENAAPSPRSDG